MSKLIFVSIITSFMISSDFDTFWENNQMRILDHARHIFIFHEEQ